MDALADRRIEGGGTPESHWLQWLAQHAPRAVDLTSLIDGRQRLVVVAPHPDDEVLMCGGLLAMLAERGGESVVVAVTDGDASHLGSPHWTRASLAEARRAESAAGLELLGIAPLACAEHHRVRRLGFPDGSVADHEHALRAWLAAFVRRDDVVVTTWQLDGHPDHDATGRATSAVCTDRGARLLQAPVWMWHWATPGDPRVPWHRLASLPLDTPAAARKPVALAAHRTQLVLREQVSGAPLDPVLGAEILARALRSFEAFFI